MNRTASKKGATGKFLALLASVTMIVAGLVGVALASPASAVAEKVWICHADTNNGNGGEDLGHGQGGENKNGFNLIETAFAAWDKGHQDRHPNDRVATGAEISQGYCGPPDPETVYYCVDNERESSTSLDGGATWNPTIPEGAQTSDDPQLDCSEDPQPQTVYYCVDNERESSTRLGEGSWRPAIPEGAQTSDDPELDCSPDVTYSDTASASLGENICVNSTTTVQLGAIGSGSSSGASSPQAAKDQAQAAANKNAADNMAAEKGKYPGATAGACPPAAIPPVAAAAAVVAPLPATVPKPAKKPAVVSAAKPAKVDGGVAGTASVPQAATVPAAVPAGDGSQAPGLPMWALAFIAVGALGAAAAGKQILGARN